MKNCGYKGDVNKKMFESARYYFRKKINKAKEESKTKTESMEEKYMKTKNKRFSKIFLCEIDKNIVDQIKKNILTQKKNIQGFVENSCDNVILTSNISAAKMFDNFCKDNKELIQVEFFKILEKNITRDFILHQYDHLKKIYKNRVYNITTKI